MLREPNLNDPTNPLVSVLVYDYRGKYLRQCFDKIINQEILTNIEIIYIDNASTDGSWDIALEYAHEYDGIITITRSNRNGGQYNFERCKRMAKGKYVVTLTDDDAFSPTYIKQCVMDMENNPLASYVMVKRKVENTPSRPNIKDKPLVSVLIHNYNYGKYLRQCFDSVLGQTYDNVEIVFSDNASSDESWNIAAEYVRRYADRMIIIRNRKNFGPGPNLENCYANINGKYFCVLCSDDAFMPGFIQKCVSALEANQEAGYAMVHRTIIDEHGSLSEEPPFYNQSCIIPGPEQAAVYMMAAVNPSISQIMYISTKIHGKLPVENILSRWYAQRLLDFNLCCEHPMVYINEPLLLNRVHSQSDSSQISGNLMEVFGQYILPYQFAEISLRGSDMNKVRERLPSALEKVGRLCLRYCTNALSTKDELVARRYFHMALAILPEISEDPIFKKIRNYWDVNGQEKQTIVESLQSIDNLTTRMISYDPPPGSVRIQMN